MIDRGDEGWQMFTEYRLARLFGWTPDEIEAAPGHWCDWALELARTEQEVRRA
jgi:hypothetical protein